MSDIAVINKIDLLDVVEVDIDAMVNDAKEINPRLQIFTTSCKTRENVDKLKEALIE